MNLEEQRKDDNNFQTLSVKCWRTKQYHLKVLPNNFHMNYRIPVGFHLQKAFLPIYSLTSPYGHLSYGQLLWSQKCLYNTDTSVKWTLGPVLLVSVLKRFDCTMILQLPSCNISLHFSMFFCNKPKLGFYNINSLPCFLHFVFKKVRWLLFLSPLHGTQILAKIMIIHMY